MISSTKIQIIMKMMLVDIPMTNFTSGWLRPVVSSGWFLLGIGEQGMLFGSSLWVPGGHKQL